MLAAQLETEPVQPATQRYFPGIDGLRALAVVSVILYHANLPGARGGFLGVEVFFVISGYLITSLLLTEWQRVGRIHLLGFWWRRARRLLPALAVLLLSVLGYTAVFQPQVLAKLDREIAATLAFVTNWYLIFTETSYFEQAERSALLQHLWSLAVEEQFYLFWPLLFVIGMRTLRPRLLGGLTLAGALASTLLMAVLYQPEVDPSRIYYGTDTRVSGLLFGATLALLLPFATDARHLQQWRTDVFDSAGLIGMVGLLACLHMLDEFQPLLYQGGFAVVALLTLLVIVAIRRGGLIAALLNQPPLVWIGQRSYSLYLWHWPIFTAARLSFGSTSNPLMLIGCVVTTGLAADLSYRLIEQPLRATPRDVSVPQARSRGWLVRNAFGLLLLVLLCGAAFDMPIERLIGFDQRAAVLGFDAPQANAGEARAIATATSSIATSIVPTAKPIPTSTIRAITVAQTTTTPTLAPPTATLASPTATPAPSAPTATPGLSGPVFAVGDSVMLGANNALARAFGPIDLHLDAKVNRRLKAATDILRDQHDAAQLGDVVIVHIGTNGPISTDQVDAMMTVLTDVRRVVIVTIRAPRWWEAPNNAVLTEAAARYPNIVLADWYGLTHDRPELFRPDGIHLRTDGARVYAEFLAANTGIVPAGATAAK